MDDKIMEMENIWQENRIKLLFLELRLYFLFKKMA
ncbi:hypothetical protein VIBC2010_13794 [Vibrio caribbeanicus ATCC BAA-2122]|uniref:Uncharacterized protein n=1 Tax=Vibrio caribbeanicus ATCC BAA-2122 TaxID=796620 RepID=E3BGR6_9VIBR|nr:hypothetical protein VIBC2010_13794 [Vibrio caribbeanicus ATCC BAA-2122]